MLKKIEVLCEKENITIGLLEKKLGFGKRTISKWKTSIPGADKLKKVADYFGVPMEYFMEEEPEKGVK